ncbi:MAG: flavin reductase family protein [bacterium]|nr:MAG: flavin reductase family protein [bacterium]
MKSLGAKTVLPSPVWVIGSYDSEGKANAMTASWVTISCSKPPCVSISLREATYTFGNIMNMGAYTVNIPSEKYATAAAYFGTVSGRDVDKFAATGLTPVKSELVNAPYIKEFPLVMECHVIQVVRLGLHTMFVAEVKDVKVSPKILDKEGNLDMAKLQPLVFNPSSWELFGVGGMVGPVPGLAAKYMKK